MDRKTVSILLPVRNAMPYLTTCIDSILKQSYQKWELIAVNDHSTDDSFEILNRYAQHDARIIILQNRGKGIIPALQLGYERSKGQYITRMDADDYMCIDKIKYFISALGGGGEVAIGLVEYFSDKTLGEGYKKYAEWLNHLTLKAANFKEIYKECVIPSPNWMLSRSDLDRIGAFHADIYPEDYDLCFRMYQAGLIIRPIPKITHYWRDHDTRASRNDPHYEDNRFLAIKLKYYLEIDHADGIPLILWGAGKKGKQIAKKLIDKKVDFIWITNNGKKLHTPIYNIILRHVDDYLADSIGTAHCIITVAAKDDQQKIKTQLKNKAQIKAFWFC